MSAQTQYFMRRFHGDIQEDHIDLGFYLEFVLCIYFAPSPVSHQTQVVIFNHLGLARTKRGRGLIK